MENLQATKIWTSTSFHSMRQTWRQAAFLVDNDLPIEVQLKSSSFKLMMNGPVGLKIHKNSKFSSPNDISLNLLKSQFSERSFSSGDVAKTLTMSDRNARRLLSWAVENQKIKKQGKSSATRYFF